MKMHNLYILSKVFSKNKNLMFKTSLSVLKNVIFYSYKTNILILNKIW